MPDDQSITLKNIIGMGIVLAVNFGVAALLAFLQASVAEVCMACVVLLLLSIVTINRYLYPCGLVQSFCFPRHAVLWCGQYGFDTIQLLNTSEQHTAFVAELLIKKLMLRSDYSFMLKPL